jgi:hypothetical protein
MTLRPFAPETPVEQRILDARTGALAGDALMREIAASNLYIPSKTEVRRDGSGFQPVMLDQDGIPFVSVYTALSRAPRDEARYLLQALGREFFLRLPPGYGVIVNPGYDAQLLLPPEGAALLKQDLKDTP